MASGQNKKTAPGKTWHARVQAAVLFCIFFTVGIVPRFDIALLIALGIVSLWFVATCSKAKDSLFKTDSGSWWQYGPALLFCLYLFANSLWSLNIGVALGKAALFAGLIAIVYVSIRAIKSQPAETLSKGARAAIWGSAIGFTITCFEFMWNHPIRWSIYNAFPAIRSEGNSVQILIRQGNDVLVVPPNLYHTPVPDEILVVQTDGLNRALVAMLLISWPLLAIVYKSLPERYRLPATCAIAALVVIAVAAGSSATAKAGLLAGALIFLLAHFWRRFSLAAITATWCMAVILALPLAYIPFKAGLNDEQRLFDSARDRIAIWGVTAERTLENPILGVGIRSTRILNRKDRKAKEKVTKPYIFKMPDMVPGQLISPPRLGLHSHNQFLQVWFELGAVGAAIVLLLGLSLLRSIRNSAARIQPLQLSAFASACVTAAFGFGLWQTWLLAAYALTAILLVYANVLMRSDTGGGKP